MKAQIWTRFKVSSWLWGLLAAISVDAIAGSTYSSAKQIQQHPQLSKPYWLNAQASQIRSNVSSMAKGA